MVQVLPSRSFGTKFSESFQPAFHRGMERFLEESGQQEKESRAMQQRRAVAQALGLDENITDPALQAAMYKEKAKDTRNQQLLKSLGILSGDRMDKEGIEPSEPIGRGEEKGFNPGDLSDEQIAGLGLINPQLASTIQRQKEARAKAERDRSKEEQRKFEAERAYHTGLTQKTREKISGLRESVPKKEAALTNARNAIETGDVGFFSADKLADITGIGAFRTAKGAQLLTAGKENLLSNMSRISAKAQNQWFEQRLNSMFPQIGQSREANLTIQSMLEGELALDKLYLQKYDEIAEADREKYGFIREDIEERARKATEPLEKSILDKTSYDLRRIYEFEQGIDKIRKNIDKPVPHGTPLTVETAQLLIDKYGDNAEKMAKKLGYIEPPESAYIGQ